MAKEGKTKRSYLSQTDVPGADLEQALRVAQAIAREYGKQPTRPLLVAQALDMSPTSGTFRTLTGASIAYGLTNGGYNAQAIEITPLGRRIVSPTTEGDDAAAKAEAVLRPRVPREFLTRYDGSPLPSQRIALNVLEEIDVPGDRTGDVFDLIVQNARNVGFLREIKGNTYVDLEGGGPISKEAPPAEPSLPSDGAVPVPAAATKVEALETGPPGDGAKNLKKLGRVFITHGSNREVVGQLKELLTFGGFTPVVALENETASKPVPEKVLDDMRSCGAAIIHVGVERKMLDDEGKQHRMLNQNVLIEIGAAMALYGSKFILLVESGAQLPSNLQGLYEVRYEGGQLGYDATMKLLKAFNDFRG